jgi:anti-anti-sigma factor
MQYSIDKPEKNISIIRLEGRLIGEYQTIQLQDSIDELLDEKQNFIVFDLEKLEYMNSTGLSFFLKTLTKVRRMDGEVMLCSLNELLLKLLVTTKLTSFFVIANSTEEALQELRKAKA